MPIDNVNTQTIFMVLFTSGSLLTWGKSLDALSSVSPRYLSTTYSQLTISPFFYRHHIMTEYAFFSQGSDRWGKELALLWGSLTICPPLQQFHISSITQSELSSLTSLKAWEEKQKIHHDIAFLFILAEEVGHKGQDIWSVDHMGEPLSGQGLLHGGSGQETDYLGLQWTQLALCLGVVK